MGVSYGKLSYEKPSETKSLTFLYDFSSTSGMPMEEVVGHCKDWMEINPTGKMGKKCFLKYMGKALAAFSQEDIAKIGEHTFRVFDSDGDEKVDFLEFMVVYNIMTWTEPKTLNILFKIVFGSVQGSFWF